MPNAARRFIALSCVLLTLLLMASPDFTALERAVSKIFVTNTAWQTGTDLPATVTPVLLRTLDVPTPEVVRSTEPVESQTPQARGVLVPLYVSFVTLQALDVHSTLFAINRGAVETNPILAGFAHRPAALIALKAGSAAGIVYMADRLRRHSRAGAIVMMAAFNSAYATVVAKNYRVANRLAR